MGSVFFRLLNISFLSYWLLPAGSIILTLFSFVGCRFRLTSKISMAFFVLCLYVAGVWLISLITISDRSILNMIGSAKVLFFVALAFLVSNLSMNDVDWRRVFERFCKFFYPASIVLLFGTYFYGPTFWGSRGDIGLVIAIATSLVAGYYLSHSSSMGKIQALLCFALGLSNLVLLQGRTALVVLIISTLYCLRLFGKDRNRKGNKLSAFILGLLLAGSAVGFFLIVFELRGGLEYVQSEEARLLALLYWLEVMKESDLPQILFGHGLGACADLIVSSFPIASSHIEQIIRSSGICYVSWGFHNTILALLFEYGAVFIFVSLYLFRSIWRSLRVEIRPYFLLYLLFIIVASPNNHLVNNDLVGTLVFFFLGIFLNKRLSKQWQQP